AFHKTANGRLMYRFHGVADLIMYDFYPYRMTTQQVAADYSDIPEVLEGQEEQWEEKVTFSLSRFAEMRRVFNFDACGNGIPVGGVAYKPMINWVQAKGAMDTPIRMHGDRMALWVPPDADLRPEPRWEAAPPPIRTVTEDNRVRINPPRLRRMPSEDRLRFYSWASVFLGSEGLAFHSLPEAPSALLYEESELSDARYAKVAQEILYFADLREDIFGNREGVDETDLLNLDYGDGPGGPLPGEFVRPQVVLYVYNRPTGAERWLFIVNPTDRIIGASMIPDRSLTRLGTETEDHVFAEYKFGDEVSPRRTITAGIPHLAVLFPHSFRLYKRVPL
ncbi:MAG TPA: hypothetical protein VEI97_18240, partial [bacterium]|nr:hypothetical protein [bacterium]